MSSNGSSVIGHKEQVPDPKTQIDLLRKYLRGEKGSTYSSPETIIFVARTATDKAINVVYTIGDLRGQRKYTNSEIDEIRAEFHRLEKLFERKKRGENIENEIDRPVLEEEEEEEPQIVGDIRHQIQTLINLAVIYSTEGKINKANKFYKKSIIQLEKAKSENIDVTDLELNIKSLSTFFK